MANYAAEPFQLQQELDQNGDTSIEDIHKMFNPDKTKQNLHTPRGEMLESSLDFKNLT